MFINKKKCLDILHPFKDKEGSKIHIKEENRGKFNRTKEYTGKSTEELTHSKNPLTRKRAIFALNAAKWKHANGGIIQKMLEGGIDLPLALADMNYANAKAYWEALGDMDPRLKAGILGNIYVESKMDPEAENASYKGLTQLGKKPLKAGIPARYSWVVNHYGPGGDNELRYVIDYVKGKLVRDSNFGYGSRHYIAGHAGEYTIDDSTNLFRKWYEGTTDKSAERRAAAKEIYKLFNKQSEPESEPESKLEVLPLSSLLLGPIIELPDVLNISKPIIPFLIKQNINN